MERIISLVEGKGGEGRRGEGGGRGEERGGRGERGERGGEGRKGGRDEVKHIHIRHHLTSTCS